VPTKIDEYCSHKAIILGLLDLLEPNNFLISYYFSLDILALKTKTFPSLSPDITPPSVL
jgi:hypothetical protein